MLKYMLRYSYKLKERTKTMNATTTTDKFAGHKYHEKELNKLGIKINREKEDFCFELYKTISFKNLIVLSIIDFNVSFLLKSTGITTLLTLDITLHTSTFSVLLKYGSDLVNYSDPKGY